MPVTGTSGVYSAEFRIRRRDNGEVRWMSGYGRVTKTGKRKANPHIGCDDRHH